MALQVWLPLNKDFRNQGLRAGITVTNNGTTFVESGSNVFNGCYHHTATQNFSINGLDYSKLNKATVALWAYYDAARNSLFFTGPTTSYYLMATSNGTGGLYNGNAGSPTFYVDGVATNTPGAAGGWHHYCVTNTNLSSWTGTTMKFNNYSSTWNYAGKVADIRIYDHVLTAGEVKELYWYKIFDLDAYDNFPGVNNLISQPSNGGLIPSTYGWAPEKHVNAIYPTNGWATGYNSGVPSPASGYHACWKIIENTPTIVFQDMNSSINQTHRWLGISNGTVAGKIGASQKYTISMEARADVTGKQISTGLYYKTISNGSNNFHDGCSTKNIGTEWKRYYWHYTTSGSLATIAGIYIYGHYGTEGVSYVRNIQVELGHGENDFAYSSRPALAYNGNGTDGVFDSYSMVESAATLYFDGTNSYIKTTDLDFMKIVDTGYTFSLWINSQEADSSRSIYFGCGDQGNGWTFALEKQASTNKFRIYNNGSPDWYVDGCVITPNQWIHVVVTRSGGTVTVYKNGVSVGTKTGFSNHTAFDKIYYVGSDYRTGDTRYKGYIGSLKIYANPLTAADVSTLYNKEKIKYQ